MQKSEKYFMYTKSRACDLVLLCYLQSLRLRANRNYLHTQRAVIICRQPEHPALSEESCDRG